MVDDEQNYTDEESDEEEEDDEDDDWSDDGSESVVSKTSTSSVGSVLTKKSLSSVKKS